MSSPFTPITSGEPPKNQANRFAHIDALRALAVMLVVLSHAGLGGVVPGGSGVTIFFTISGFIISLLVLRERDSTGTFSIGGFYFRRAVKILPPFMLIVLLPTLIYAIWNPLDWWAVAAQIGFVFNWVPDFGNARVLPGTGVVWSLAIEEQFYLLFAPIWLVLVARPTYRRGLIIVAAVAIVLPMALRFSLADLGIDVSDRIQFGSDTRFDSIGWGVLAAAMFHRWTKHLPGMLTHPPTRLLAHDMVLLLALALYLASLCIRDPWFRDTLRYTLQSTATALVIVYGLLPGQGWLRAVFYRVAAWRPVQVIGLSSYSIYLLHMPLMHALAPLLAGYPRSAQIALLISAGVAGGCLSYQLIEVPALRWRQKRESRHPAQPTSGEVLARQDRAGP